MTYSGPVHIQGGQSLQVACPAAADSTFDLNAAEEVQGPISHSETTGHKASRLLIRPALVRRVNKRWSGIPTMIAGLNLLGQPVRVLTGVFS